MNVQFHTAQVARLIKPFLVSQKQGRDIITRSMLMVPKKSEAWLYTTDGISHLRARVPIKNSGFIDPVVFSLDSFYTAIKSGSEWTTLTLEDGVLWAGFFGGRVHLQTFNFNPKLFQGRLPAKASPEVEVDTALHERAISALHQLTEVSDIPDLCYLFLGPQGAFASSGAMVAKVSGEFPELTLRRRDSRMIEALLEAHEGETFKVQKMRDRVLIRTKYLDYVFPAVTQRLPDQHKARPGESVDFFTLPVPFLKKSLRLLSNITDSSGVLSLDFGEELQAEMRSQKGHISSFLVSNKREGEPANTKIQTLVKTLLLATNVFQGEDHLKVGVKLDGSLLMWSSDKALNFITKPGMR